MKLRWFLIAFIAISGFILYSLYAAGPIIPPNPERDGVFYPPRTFGKVGPLNYNPY